MIEYLEDIEEPEEISEEGTEVREMYEHHRIEADKGQLPLRIDKFLMTRLPERFPDQNTRSCGCRLYLGQRQSRKNPTTRLSPTTSYLS